MALIAAAPPHALIQPPTQLRKSGRKVRHAAPVRGTLYEDPEHAFEPYSGKGERWSNDAPGFDLLASRAGVSDPADRLRLMRLQNRLGWLAGGRIHTSADGYTYGVRPHAALPRLAAQAYSGDIDSLLPMHDLIETHHPDLLNDEVWGSLQDSHRLLSGAR